MLNLLNVINAGQVICIIKDSYDLSLTLPRDYSETTWRIVQSNYFLYNTVNIGYFRARSPENIQQFCNLHDNLLLNSALIMPIIFTFVLHDFSQNLRYQSLHLPAMNLKIFSR